MTTSPIEQLSINTIRTLSMDAVQQANSGHPGTPMALAPVAYTIWQRFLNYDPADPGWANRDRFVLSNGHASMLLYSVLYLAQVKAITAPGIPNTVTPRAWKPPQGLWAKAWPRASEWRLAKGGSPSISIALDSKFLTTKSTCFAATVI